MKKKPYKLIQLLSPYGNMPHAKGLQIVDKKSALKMEENFPSGVLSRFFKKIPIYVGHPDEHEKKSALKTHIVGYIEKIIALEDGIAALCTYDETSYKKIITKQLRSMSPRWKTRELDDGSFMPIELISVGLTNEPNIENSGEILSPSRLLSQEKSLENKASKEKFLHQKLTNSILNSKNCINTLNKIKNIQESLTESISKRLVSSALNTGTISANECHKWTNDFKDKFGETKKKLIQISSKNSTPTIKELLSLTRQRMAEKNLSWDSAYKEIKRENF